MSKEESAKKRKTKTQKITFRLGGRQYTLAQEIPIAAGVGDAMRRIDHIPNDPILWQADHRLKFVNGVYLSEVRAHGAFPLENLELSLVKAYPTGRKNEYKVDLNFKSKIDLRTLPTGRELADAANQVIRVTQYTGDVIPTVGAIEEDYVSFYFTIHPNAAVPLAGQVLEDVAEELCTCIAHRALLQAYHPLILRGRELGFLINEGNIYPNFTLPNADRISETYLADKKRPDTVRIFLELFEGRDAIEYVQVRDRIFSTTKYSPRPLFRAGTQKTTRDGFLIPLLRRLEQAHIISSTGHLQWRITPYGREVYESLESAPPNWTGDTIFYRIKEASG